jgi:hypothetical protein
MKPTKPPKNSIFCNFFKLVDLILIAMTSASVVILLALMFVGGQFESEFGSEHKIHNLPGLDAEKQPINLYAGYLESSANWRHFYW